MAAVAASERASTGVCVCVCVCVCVVLRESVCEHCLYLSRKYRERVV